LQEKLGRVARLAGEKLLYYVLVLYHVLNDELTPSMDKLVIVGALGYFILPIDVIPDFIIGLGYTDDMAVLMAAYSRISKSITPEVEMKAKYDLFRLFGRDIV
jgi:uncharacterized membrane protein YkvA (DUF1232 family)